MVATGRAASKYCVPGIPVPLPPPPSPRQTGAPVPVHPAEFRAEWEEQLAAAEGPLARLRVMLAHQKQFIVEKSDTFEVYYDFWVQATKRPSVGDKIRQMNSGWRAVIRELLDDGVRSGVFRADRVKMAPAILVSILQGVALQYILDPEEFDLDLYFEQAEEYLIHFLGTGSSD